MSFLTKKTINNLRNEYNDEKLKMIPQRKQLF